MTYDESYQKLLQAEREARKADAVYGEASEEALAAYKRYATARQVWADLWQPKPNSRRKVTA